MQIGFKTGPRNWDEGKRIVEEDGARLCEMWFRIDRASQYDDMLAWLGDHHVKTGLHHWGLIDETYKTNLATNNDDIRLATIQQIKDTIDIGAKIGCAYVNAHPGAALVEKLDMEHGLQEPVLDQLTDPEESAALFLTSAEELGAYANDQGVVLTLETLPLREQHTLGKRDRLYDSYGVPLAVLAKLGTQKNYLANDITHTMAAASLWETDGERLWHLCFEFSRATAPFTKLLHVNTLMPPQDGTDSHDGVTDSDFARGVVPNREQILALLSVFADRDDVCVIPEPRDNMQANFRALQALVKSI